LTALHVCVCVCVCVVAVRVPHHSCYLCTRCRWPNYLCIAYATNVQL